MGLLDKWNKNKFSIYKSEEKTVLKLIQSLGKWVEDLIKVTENKTDLYGDHKGTWQGLNKPTLSEEGMRATVEQITNKSIPNIQNNIVDIETQLAENANYAEVNYAKKTEVTNVMTPKGTIAYASLPVSGNEVGWYYYCPDGDGTNGPGNYVWNGTAWYFGGTGDEGYSKLKSDLDHIRNIGLSAVVLNFEQGGLDTSTGEEIENEARIRSNIVKVIAGSKIKLNDTLYKFGVWQYNADGSFITYRGLEQTDFVADKDMYIRVVVARNNQNIALGISESSAIDAYLYSYDISKIDSLNRTMSEIEKVEIENWKTGWITTNQEIGSVVPLTRTPTLAWVYQVVKCTKGDKFIVTGYGGNSPKSWCFTNETLVKLSGGNTSDPLYPEEIEAEEDGFLIVNSAIINNHKLEKLCTGIVSNDEIRQDVEKSIKEFGEYDKIIPPSMPEIRYCIESVPHNKTAVMTLDEIINGYDNLVETYPDYVTKTLLGKDASDTYPIYRYDFCPSVPRVDGNVKVISHSYKKTDYPVIIMDACIHGAERPCAKAMLNLMTLIANAKDNSILGWLRNNIHFVIIPISNVWGYANDSRTNSNGVDLNRNFPVYWEFGDSTTDNDRYKGESPLSEEEAQYLNSIFEEFENNAVCYYNWHTHGLFTGYDVMTCFSASALRDFDAMQNIGFDVIKSITASGWINHNLPQDSGYIGMVQVSEQKGLVSHTGTMYGIPSACPEVMYRYYDGGQNEVYNNDVDCMNVEYMLYAVGNACKEFLY